MALHHDVVNGIWKHDLVLNPAPRTLTFLQARYILLWGNPELSDWILDPGTSIHRPDILSVKVRKIFNHHVVFTVILLAAGIISIGP